MRSASFLLSRLQHLLLLPEHLCWRAVIVPGARCSHSDSIPPYTGHGRKFTSLIRNIGSKRSSLEHKKLKLPRQICSKSKGGPGPRLSLHSDTVRGTGLRRSFSVQSETGRGVQQAPHPITLTLRPFLRKSKTQHRREAEAAHQHITAEHGRPFFWDCSRPLPSESRPIRAACLTQSRSSIPVHKRHRTAPST